MIKKFFFQSAGILACFSAGTLFAETANEKQEPVTSVATASEAPQPPPHIRKISPKELQMLKTLFLMSDKDLARMRKLISRLERTPEAKRRKMAEDLDRATSGKPEVQQKFMEDMRRRFETRRKNLLERYYATLPEEQAKAEAAAFLKMSRREQFEYMNAVREKLGLPPPNRNGEKRAPKDNKPPKETSKNLF